MDHGALDHALEAGGRLGVVLVVDDQRGQFDVEIVHQALLQSVEVDIAGPHDPGRVVVVGERQQQVFQRGVLVLALVGVSDGAMQGFFKWARKRGQGEAPQSFSMVHCRGC
jgi:hypothetical protein